MTRQVLIAHAEDEEDLAEKLARPIREAGYEVIHGGTMLVGESVIQEVSKAIGNGSPVVLCGTITAIGTGWAQQVVTAARQNHSRARIFAVQMEKKAYVQQLSLDEVVATYWQDPAKAERDLVRALKKYYPLEDDNSGVAPEGYDAERRYRELALEACDIIDLANLPETDRHIATRQLELRRLYVPLRVRVEIAPDLADEGADLEALELRREALRRGDGADGGAEPARVPVGERLAAARRLVILGDPGAGKTTMVRWLTTAYLLRLKSDPDWKHLPDVETLPDEDLLPIIVRCRDLNAASLAGPLDEIIRQTLRMKELDDRETAALLDLLRARLREGRALLLLDGLDEVSTPSLRERFCRQLEQFHIAYPDAAIVATSRIVGYREMGYRIGRGFEHVTVADLTKEDKDEFARRWSSLTERPERREAAAEELIQDIHSSDRIERLTANPMLLTTMALVRRKVGKLPRRRADLYWEAVQVLLNWRSEVDERIDTQEAIPQLEYLAYAMCDRGVQQLREDEVVELFARMREEYQQIHALRKHSPEEFLRLLERRTGILVEAGHKRHLGRPVPVYEFRHLTVQEYLAALALVDGRFPGRDRARSLAEHVAPLAGRVEESKGWSWTPSGEKEKRVTESWRETLHLCVASCKDDDVDSVLLAITSPQPGEDPAVTARPRAIEAALCLAEEPNVSEDTARTVVRALVGISGEYDGIDVELLKTNLTQAVQELARSRWSEVLSAALLDEFCRRPNFEYFGVGEMFSIVAKVSYPEEEKAQKEWVAEQAARLKAGSEAEAVAAALSIASLTRPLKIQITDEIKDGLLRMLGLGIPVAKAGARAIYTFNQGLYGSTIWQPEPPVLETLVNIVADPSTGEGVLAYLVPVLGIGRYQQAVKPLITRLDHENPIVRKFATTALGKVGDSDAVEPLLDHLNDQTKEVQQAVISALGELGDPRAVEPLITYLNTDDAIQPSLTDALSHFDDPRAIAALKGQLSSPNSIVKALAFQSLLQREDAVVRILLSSKLNGAAPFLSLQNEIDEERVQEAAGKLVMAAEKVRRRYEELAGRYPLKLSWVAAEGGGGTEAGGDG